MTMIAIALLLAAVPRGPAAVPDAAAIRAAAARCGLPADWLRYGHDADGDFADPTTEHRDFGLTPEKLLCLTQWVERTHARFAFISEPPPGPQILATVPVAAIQDAIREANRCALPIRLDPLDESRVMILARRHAPRGPLACLRAWVRALPRAAS
jgi:hypothetical protein